MEAKTSQNILLFSVVALILLSLGTLYVKYIVNHDYDILYLTEEEREEFLLEAEIEEEAEESLGNDEGESEPVLDSDISPEGATSTDTVESATETMEPVTNE